MKGFITRRGGKGSSPFPSPPSDEQIVNYIMLYDEGDECVDVTGGWDRAYYVNTNGSITKKSNHISYTRTDYDCGLYVQKVIDLTGYSQAHVILNNLSGTNGAYFCKTKTSKGQIGSYDSSPVPRVNDQFKATPITTNGLASITVADLDTLNGPTYYNKPPYPYIGIGLSKVSFDMYSYFLTKADDYNTLCSKVGKTTTSLKSLLADTETLTAIFNSKDAVEFMIKQCTGDFMVGVLNNETAVGLLKESLYLNSVIANEHWAKFIMMIPTAKSLLNYTMLYDNGDECTDVTGGWSGGTETNDHMTVSESVIAKMTNSISDQDISGVGCVAQLTSGTYSYSRFHMGIDSEKSIRILYGNAASTSSTQYIVNNLQHNRALTYATKSWLGKGFNTITIANANCSYATANIYNVFYTNTDSFTAWASKAGITATNLDTLLADSTSMATLMSNQNAVDYLAGCTGDLMVSILNSTVAVSAITSSTIAVQRLTKHPAWKKFIDIIPTSIDAGLNLV